MSYLERVEHNLRGLHAVSVGACGACDECRDRAGIYGASDDWSSDEERWTVKALPGEFFASEDEAIEAGKRAFERDVQAGRAYSSDEFSWGECCICDSRLGGSREVVHFLMDGRLQHADGACADCVLYLANGEVPSDPS
jgi:hypothetical protein